MLILSRRLGESIKIGDEVTVTILQVKGGQVRIGIDAPREIAVHREEIYQRIANASPQASSITPAKVTAAQGNSKTTTRAVNELA